MRTSTKGISPLIASVLLLAFTMTIAMLAGPFLTSTTQSIQDNNDEQAKKILASTDLGLELVSARYNITTSNLTLAVKNTGTAAVENISITVFGEKPYHRKFTQTVQPRRIKTFEIEAGDAWNVKEVKAALTDYPVSTSRDIDGRPAEDRLIAYWPMDEGTEIFLNSTVNTRSFKLRNDSTNCYNGGCPSWVDGIHGSAVDFDGIGDHGLIEGNNQFFGKTESFTVSFWARWDSFNQWSRIIDFGTNSGNNGGVLIANRGTSNNFILEVRDSSGTSLGKCEVSNGIDKDKWTHWTTVWTDGKQTIYKNGKLVKTCSYTGTWGQISESNKYLGESNWDADGYFNGKIDELKVWNKALSPERIRNPVSLE